MITTSSIPIYSGQYYKSSNNICYLSLKGTVGSLIASDKKNEKKIINNINLGSIGWTDFSISSDRNFLYRKSSMTSEIYLLENIKHEIPLFNFRTLVETSAKINIDRGQYTAVSFSPDSKQVVFCLIKGNQSEIYLLISESVDQ